jgi:hypothetical protein
LSKHPVIRALLSGFFLILFAFSATPKLFLHGFLANHRDAPLQKTQSGRPLVGTAGFHCDCDNLVVESPFTGSRESVASPHVPVLVRELICNTSDLLAAASPLRSLRAPPTSC